VGLIALAALVLMPPAAIAQDGPQFGNWGPGKSPPEQEGPGTPPSGGSNTYGAQPDAAGAAAPYAPMPGTGLMPIPWSGGCSYDLRGTWWNDGRWTAPSYATYSQYVVVRQYRNWIQALQDDGTGYYGQCNGSSLSFDVYQGYTFVGHQTGSINGPVIYYPYPMPLADSSAPYASTPGGSMPSGGTLRASFSWASLFGSGTESWQRTSTAYRPLPIPYALDVPPVTTPAPAPTPAPTRVPPPQPAAMHLDVLSPSSGPSGTDVVVVGIGFSADDNIVTFGPSAGLRHPDGTPGNLVVRAGSPDGRTLRFTVPASGPSGILCDSNGSGCVGVTAALLQPGRYDVTVVNNASGSSNSVSFELVPSGEASIE